MSHSKGTEGWAHGLTSRLRAAWLWTVIAAAAWLLVLGPGVARADGIPPPSASWTLGGTATFDNSGNLQLTGGGGYDDGSAYWPTAVSPGSLTASFDETITGSGNTADGFAFDLLDSSSAGAGGPTTGDPGAALGFGFTNRGRAVAFVENAAPWGCYPSDHFLGVADGTENTICPTLNYLTTASPIPALVGSTHHVIITVTFGAHPAIDVSLDGTQEIAYADTDTATPFPSSVFVGFSGAGGNGGETDTISNVSISYTPAPSPIVVNAQPGNGTAAVSWHSNTTIPGVTGYRVAAVTEGNNRRPRPAAAVPSAVTVSASAPLRATLKGFTEDCHQLYRISVTPETNGSPSGSAAYSPVFRPSGIVTPGKRPPYVVVMLDGIGSQEAGFSMDPYHPTAIGPDSYCPQNVNNGVPVPITTGTGANQLPNNAFRGKPYGPKEFFFKWNAWDPADDHGSNVPKQDSNSTPRGLVPGTQTYDKPTYSWMLDGIAATGAMILPYSYWGATMQGHGSADPTFVFNAYTDCNSTPAPSCTQDNHLDPGGKPDPSHQDYDNAVHSFSLSEDEDRLKTEVDSIENVWPNEPIVIIGHSQGGLIAFETWRQHMLPGAAHHLFSLDSPINGVCAGRNVGLPCGGPPGYPPYADRFFLDPAYLLQDGGTNAAFRFVGTLGDEVRVNLPGPKGSTPGYETGNDTLQHQLLVTGYNCTAGHQSDCPSRVDHISECQLPEQPWVLNRVTPVVTDQNRWIYDTGHFVVKWCPGNITYFNRVLGLTNYGTP